MESPGAARLRDWFDATKGRMTKAKLARRIGCHPSRISRWARGHERPSLAQALLLERATTYVEPTDERFVEPVYVYTWIPWGNDEVEACRKSDRERDAIRPAAHASMLQAYRLGLQALRGHEEELRDLAPEGSAERVEQERRIQELDEKLTRSETGWLPAHLDPDPLRREESPE